MTPSGKTICLNMIVKNEVANLERCLRSVVDHIGCWLICDTGSTDGTQDLIRRFFESHGVVGELHSIPFANFGQARNEALDLARTSRLTFDYLLFADADMELSVTDRAFSTHLEAEVYQLRQDSGVAYWNTRLLRRNAQAHYVGVTHEYLDLKAGETVHLDGLAFIDYASGTNRPGKFARDTALLLRGLETEPDPGLRARYTFYLANSLRDDGDRAGALDRYLERARLGQWNEEVFVSLLNAAELQDALEYPIDEVLATFEKANAAMPTRAEALHGAARFCRDKALHDRGYEFARRGAAISIPHVGLFVAEWIYKYGLLDELSVAAYWSGHYAECVVACDRLLGEPSLPLEYRPRVQDNKNFATDRMREQEEARSLATAAPSETAPAIPRLFHFITGLDSNFGGKAFSFVHALAILSALHVNEGFVARVYYEYEPQGPYWDLAKQHVTRVPIVAPREFCGQPVEHFANRADICRLQILLEHGGIYLDIDTICQKPFAPLLDGSVVMGLEKTTDGTTIGLCNATIIAPAKAAFLKLWLDSYNDFKIWNRFAVQLPMRLAKDHPDLVRIEPNTAFFWPSWDYRGIAALFLEDNSYPEAYSFHLWESKSWEHIKHLDADSVKAIDTTYNRVARRFSAAVVLATNLDAVPKAIMTFDPALMEETGKRATLAALGSFWQQNAMQRRLDTQMEAYWATKRDRSLNPLVKKGEKYFSQSDEDGITLEICRRIGVTDGRALEFGVGNGLENNSLILLMSGWQVFWVGGEQLAIEVPPSCQNLAFSRSWVTADNCVSLASALMGPAGLAAVNLLSVDVDGNDIYLIEQLLESGMRPEVVIVEYNGKFPPPIRWRIRYDANHVWDGSDYQGASLQSFVDVLSAHGYRLICCALTGVNAFFVRSDYAHRFDDVPEDIGTLFYPADYNWFVQRGHWVSTRTIEAVLRI